MINVYKPVGRVDRNVNVYKGIHDNLRCRFFLGTKPDKEHTLSSRIYRTVGSEVPIEASRLKGRAILVCNEGANLLLTGESDMIVAYFSSDAYKTSFRTTEIEGVVKVGDNFRLSLWNDDKKQNTTIQIGNVTQIITFSTLVSDTSNRVRNLRPQFVSKIADAIVDHTKIDELEG
jgi:hypothetical protein